MKPLRASCAALTSGALLLLNAGSARAADRAEYVDPSELEDEGLSHLLTLDLIGTFARLTDSSAKPPTNFATFGLRTRFHLLRPVSYCTGLDADIGGSDDGVVYGATAYVTGLGVRWGNGNVISLCGGVGLDAVGESVPVAARFPAELSGGFDLGPIRPVLWLRPVWLAGRAERKEGASLSFLDEMETGLSIRLARQHRYWSNVSAGGGIILGVTYRELYGAHAIGGFVGIDLAGEQ